MKRYVSAGLTLLAVAVFFSSCHLFRGYKSPEVESDRLFRDEEPVPQEELTAADTVTIADIPWSQYFTDPLLVSLIEEGIQNNFDLQVAYTRIRQAEASLSVARNAYFPDIALVGQANHARSSQDMAGNKDVLGYYSNNYSLGISVTWEADLWGKLTRQKKAQLAAFQNSQAYRNLVQTSLISNIATSYYALLALDEQLGITQQTIGLLEESTRTMEALMDAGLLTGAAVQQSRALYYNTLISVPDLEATIRETENALCVMLGRNPGPIERTTLAGQRVDNMMDHGVPMQMLARRPDVQSAELSFRQAFELTQAARASFYPSITLGTGSMFGYAQANNLQSFFNARNIVANVIGGLTMPILAKRQLASNLKSAKAAQEAALLGFEKAVLDAGREVSDILYGYSASVSKNENREKQVESLSTAVYFTQELLKAGEANYTEVLSAEQNLLSARLGQVSDRLEQLQYSVTLYKALGGGVY